MIMSEDIQKVTNDRMLRAVELLQGTFVKVRTGRAHPTLLEHVQVSYYGNNVPLNQVASVAVADARTLLVSPWDKTMVPVIEKAILTSDLGLNPVAAGQTIRIPLPPMTEERRKELIKVIHGEGENARINIRNIRRDANMKIKTLLKDKALTEDDEHRMLEAIQKLTDKHIAEIDKLLEKKEAELMEI
jgi:ribosome recycling factor